MHSIGYNTELCIFCFDENKIKLLLLTKDNEFYLPGHLIDKTKDAKKVANLILEKMNIAPKFLRHYAVFDEPNRDVRGRIVSNLFYVIANKDEHNYVALEQIEYEKISYDHSEIIKKAIINLKKDLLETLIGKHFLNQEFTIKELQNLLQNTTSSQEITRTHFYTKIQKKAFIKQVVNENGVQKTKKFTGIKRPSKLFMFDDASFISSVYF